MRRTKVSGKGVTEVDFEVLEDGSLVEMIEDPVCPTKTLLAVYKDGNMRYAGTWREGSRTLVPIPRHVQVLKHVCFPAGCESYLGLADLASHIGSFFVACADLDFAWVMWMIGFVFSTWVPETSPVAPYLALLGPPGSGKTTVMRILRLLCRRSLLVSDISSAGFFDICNRLSPTLLIDETATAGHPRTLLHLLRSSFSPGSVSLRKGSAQMAYGPKVLAWTELPNDPALNSRCVIIPMHKTSRTDLLSPDDPKILERAKRIRMRLQQFRFEHYRKLPIPKVPAGVQLSSRALDIYRAFAGPVGEDQHLCKFLAHLVASQSQFQPSVISPLQASAVRNLHRFIHFDSKAAGYKLKGLTQAMMADLVSRGEPSRLNERKVGDVLTSLGFTNRSRTNPGGYALWLQRSDRIRIHEMARDYEIEGAEPSQDCDICKEINKAYSTTVADEISEQTQVPSTEKRKKHEHRERHEHIRVAAIRAVNRRAKRRPSRFGNKQAIG